MNQYNKENWLGTLSGKKINLHDPQPDQFDIRDIALGLSRQARFAGQTNKFYSVAQHSVYASQLCDEAPLDALLHDAAEAYIGDIPRPAKLLCPEIQVLEDRIYRAIATRFGIEPVIPDCVHRTDRMMLVTEYRDLCDGHPKWDLAEYPPCFPLQVIPWPSEQAYDVFIILFSYLTARQ